MSETERLRTQLRQLGLPTIAQTFEEEATNAAKGELSFTAFLARLADAEVTAKVWTPALLQFAHKFGFHPEACTPGADNQKGSVESLVKWVKGSFLGGRVFADDADLAAQQADWVKLVNTRPSSATGVPPGHVQSSGV